MTSAEYKKKLRTQFKQQRLQIPPAKHAQKSTAICEHLSTWLAAKSYTCIYLFLSINNEPNLLPLIERLKEKAYTTALPKIDISRNKMQFFTWSPGEELSKNRFGIAEPVRGKECAINSQTVMLVPALAMAKDGHRLGYGGGYYDRFFASHPTAPATSIGVVFSEFVMDELPNDLNDHRLGFIATDSRIEASAGIN